MHVNALSEALHTLCRLEFLFGTIFLLPEDFFFTISYSAYLLMTFFSAFICLKMTFFSSLSFAENKILG